MTPSGGEPNMLVYTKTLEPISPLRNFFIHGNKKNNTFQEMNHKRTSETAVWLRDCYARLPKSLRQMPLLDERNYPDSIQVCERLIQLNMIQASSAVTTTSQNCVKT